MAHAQVTASSIHPTDRLSQGEVNGRWVIEARAGIGHDAGTLVADAAPVGSPDSDTFTAPNGKRYWDISSKVQWAPR